MYQLVTGFHDMYIKNIIHRDLKLQNIMLHFPDHVEALTHMSKEQKKRFLRDVDLATVNF